MDRVLCWYLRKVLVDCIQTLKQFKKLPQKFNFKREKLPKNYFLNFTVMKYSSQWHKALQPMGELVIGSNPNFEDFMRLELFNNLKWSLYFLSKILISRNLIFSL